MHFLAPLIEKKAVERLQAEMMQFPQLELPTQHYFVDGMYCRVLPRPKGTLIVGKVHKKEHFYICAKGRVQVTTDSGVRDIDAGTVLVCKPGTKRAVLALEDSVCLTVHRTDKTELAEVEDELVESETQSLYGPGNTLRIK
jgi:mannose-6-phosphate isomerase-like protein (cupin superfamily)